MIVSSFAGDNVQWNQFLIRSESNITLVCKIPLTLLAVGAYVFQFLIFVMCIIGGFLYEVSFVIKYSL